MNIQAIYDYAKLATLAYVDLSGYSRLGFSTADIIKEGVSNRNPGKTERIPTALGTQMFNPGGSLPDGTVISADTTGQWTVLDPYFNPSVATGHSDPASGFAAMLVSNPIYGKVLAIAGTEPNAPGQFEQDFKDADVRQIGFWGAALGQIVSLYNYVQVLRGTGKVDQLVLKLESAPPANLQSFFVAADSDTGSSPMYLWLEKTAQADGLGMIGANEKLTITGHSLGGHLSAMAVALFPDLFTSAVTFNAPGFNPPTTLSALGADNLLGLFRQLGESPAAVASISDRVSTFESEGAATGDDWDAVSGNATGTPFSKEQYVTVEKNTHDVGHMLDGLAIQALFARLDTTLDLSKAGRLIEAAGTATGRYEALLKILHRMMTGRSLEGVPDGETYRQRLLDEVGSELDLSRVHFLGKVPYPVFLKILQVSRVHVYLTYPFVLSWSMLEAMSSGCLVIGSRTAPVEEVLHEGENGLLVDFFSPREIAERTIEALAKPEAFVDLRRRARQTVAERYDLHQIALPKQLELIAEVLEGRRPHLAVH